MMQVLQKCGWCKALIRHRVLTNDTATTGVADLEKCPKCNAPLLPFATPDGLARIQSSGQPDKKVGEPAWAVGTSPGPPS